MEANICDTNHLDGNVLLPPRKRLLAGFKKQRSDGSSNDNDTGAVHLPAAVPSSSACILSFDEYSSEFDASLNNLLKSTTSNSKFSPEEIAELAESAAVAAVKAAKDARAAAEQKAAIATRAITAAKTALDFVTSLNEEIASKERHLKKNSLKKHIPVQLLYKKNQPMEDSKKDEELARRLHRVMNSSPRISKNLSKADLKGHKLKKRKILPSSERIAVSDGGSIRGGIPACASSGHPALCEVDFENRATIRELYTVNADEEEKEYRYGKMDQLRMGNREAGANPLAKRALEETSSHGKKRGRLKLKKLPLSFCTSKDRENIKEGMINRTAL